MDFRQTGQPDARVTQSEQEMRCGDATYCKRQFLLNTKSRRAKLTTDKLQALADLGLEWRTPSAVCGPGSFAVPGCDFALECV